MYQCKYTYTECSVKRTPNLQDDILHIIFSENVISLYGQLTTDRYKHFSDSSYCTILDLSVLVNQSHVYSHLC